MKKHYLYIILAILVGILINVGLYFFWTKQAQETSRQEARALTLPTIDLNEKSGILVNALKSDNLTLEVAQFNDQPLMEQVIDNSLERPEPEIEGNIPWFYYSPGVTRRSPLSMANKMRLVRTEDFNDFAWYQAGD